jgi:hypothetical protein
MSAEPTDDGLDPEDARLVDEAVARMILEDIVDGRAAYWEQRQRADEAQARLDTVRRVVDTWPDDMVFTLQIRRALDGGA